MPERIQLKRVKGWRIPAGVVIVDRRTKWGNPYRSVNPVYAVADFASALEDCLAGISRTGFDNRLWGRFPGPDEWRQALEELRGKDLGCWCSPRSACHANVLIEFANRQASTREAVTA